MDTQERILLKANELFLRYGIKTISMDDIARELGISKKTIYQHFEDKDTLVYEAIKYHMEEDRKVLERIRQTSADALDIIFEMTDMMRKQLASANPSMVFDTKKYHPRSWRFWQEHKKGFLLGEIQSQIKQGIGEGLFRAEINIEILSRIRMEAIEMGFNPDVFPPAQFSDVLDIQLTMLDNFLRGILTIKGLEKYEKKLAQEI